MMVGVNGTFTYRRGVPGDAVCAGVEVSWNGGMRK